MGQVERMLSLLFTSIVKLCKCFVLHKKLTKAAILEGSDNESKMAWKKTNRKSLKVLLSQDNSTFQKIA